MDGVFLVSGMFFMFTSVAVLAHRFCKEAKDRLVGNSGDPLSHGTDIWWSYFWAATLLVLGGVLMLFALLITQE